jgi:hypothetical protein
VYAHAPLQADERGAVARLVHADVHALRAALTSAVTESLARIKQPLRATDTSFTARDTTEL